LRSYEFPDTRHFPKAHPGFLALYAQQAASNFILRKQVVKCPTFDAVNALYVLCPGELYMDAAAIPGLARNRRKIFHLRFVS
jgi:hypothetical protein